MQKAVKVDNKVRVDPDFPAGFMDVVELPKTGDQFRLLYDTKGRFVLHRISDEEKKFKLAKVIRQEYTKKAIPYIATSDGRTIRYPDPLIKVGDTVKIDLETGKVVDHIKFEVGNLVTITRGPAGDNKLSREELSCPRNCDWLFRVSSCCSDCIDLLKDTVALSVHKTPKHNVLLIKCRLLQRNRNHGSMLSLREQKVAYTAYRSEVQYAPTATTAAEATPKVADTCDAPLEPEAEADDDPINDPFELEVFDLPVDDESSVEDAVVDDEPVVVVADDPVVVALEPPMLAAVEVSPAVADPAADAPVVAAAPVDPVAPVVPVAPVAPVDEAAVADPAVDVPVVVAVVPA
ncbi:unnamed protein product [Phytophthora lilii]|uniref:Unnamed protein product n=1 Tax=Phytophthora lilii TaxID=2077276 RepID=A0A9W6TPP9_9STRA|nr:unnamed protein product [Phytophthora lilii]